MSVEIAINQGLVAVSGEMTIYFAAEMKQRLLDALNDDCGELVLNLSHVSELDTCGVQLVLAFRAAAQEAGRALRISAISEPVGEVFALYGLQSLLGLAEAA